MKTVVLQNIFIIFIILQWHSSMQNNKAKEITLIHKQRVIGSTGYLNLGDALLPPLSQLSQLGWSASALHARHGWFFPERWLLEHFALVLSHWLSGWVTVNQCAQRLDVSAERSLDFCSTAGSRRGRAGAAVSDCSSAGF